MEYWNAAAWPSLWENDVVHIALRGENGRWEDRKLGRWEDLKIGGLKDFRIVDLEFVV